MQLSIDLLRQDSFLQRTLPYLLPTEYDSLGRYVDIRSMDALLEKMSLSRWERLKFLPVSKYTIFRTSDIGVGYNYYLSLLHLQEKMDMGHIHPDTPISLEYKHGNIFAYIDSKDIDTKSLLTEDTYLFMKETTSEVSIVRIGKPTNPNRLYYKDQYHGITTTLKRLRTVEGMNAVYIRTQLEDGLDTMR